MWSQKATWPCLRSISLEVLHPHERKRREWMPLNNHLIYHHQLFLINISDSLYVLDWGQFICFCNFSWTSVLIPGLEGYSLHKIANTSYPLLVSPWYQVWNAKQRFKKKSASKEIIPTNLDGIACGRSTWVTAVCGLFTDALSHLGFPRSQKCLRSIEGAMKCFQQMDALLCTVNVDVLVHV